MPDNEAGGGEPVVVLSYGFLMHRTMFADGAAVLHDTFRVITLDEPRSGYIGQGDQPITLLDAAYDCLGLMDHPGVERALLDGLAQVGLIALRGTPLALDGACGPVLLDVLSGPGDTELTSPIARAGSMPG